MAGLSPFAYRNAMGANTIQNNPRLRTEMVKPPPAATPQIDTAPQNVMNGGVMGGGSMGGQQFPMTGGSMGSPPTPPPAPSPTIDSGPVGGGFWQQMPPDYNPDAPMSQTANVPGPIQKPEKPPGKMSQDRPGFWGGYNRVAQGLQPLAIDMLMGRDWRNRNRQTF